MSVNDVAIRIGADFVGLPAFKKADTAVEKLYKSTKKLAAGFGVAFSATAITRFAAASVRAFAAEEKQIAALTSTVKALGIAFTAPEINQFIENLERLTGITREELQPSFQKLLTQTGSITKSQKILAAAVEVSFSGIMSVSEAADALSQAYVGNVKGLKKFNLGLTNAELAAMSFDEVLQKVSKTYKDQFAAALDTTAVKLDKMKVAADNAKESIGSGLVDAFANLIGGGNLDKANAQMERFGQTVADVLKSVTSSGWKSLFEFLNPATTGGMALPNVKNIGKGGSYFSYKQQQLALTKAEAAAAAKAKKLEDAKLTTLRKQNAEKKAAAILDKANATLLKAQEQFDIEGIQLAAALKNQSLSEEERKRLEVKQAIYNLEQALLSKDQERIDAATALLQKLLSQLDMLGKIKSLADELGANIELIDLTNLTDALSILSAIKTVITSGAGAAALKSATSPESMAWTAHEQAITANRRSFIESTASTSATTATQSPVVVNITDNAIKIVDVVVESLQDQSASGISTRIIRNTGGLNW